MDHQDWDQRYRDADCVWGLEPNRFLAAEVAELAPGRALDVACGEGRNAVWLAEQGWSVTAVDFSGVALDRGRARAERAGVEVSWLQADVVGHRPPPHTFDLVVIAYLHLPFDRLAVVLEAASEALAPGGTLVVVAHARSNLADGYGGPQDPAVLAEPAEIAAALPDLTVRRAEPVIREVETESGPRRAVDLLVRAQRLSGV